MLEQQFADFILLEFFWWEYLLTWLKEEVNSLTLISFNCLNVVSDCGDTFDGNSPGN